MSRKRKIITAICLLTVTCGLYTWGIPAFVNIKARKAQIEDLIYKNTEYKVDIGTPKMSMGFFPSVWLESDSVSLLNDDGTKAANILKPKVQIKLLPLLKKKIVISRLSAQKEEFNFVFSKDSKFYLGQYLLQAPKKKSEFQLAKIDLNLGEYDIILNDEKYGQNIIYSGKYFQHGVYIPNKQVRFATDSVLKLGEKETPIFADVDINLPINRISEDHFKINANVEEFDLSTISHYMKYWTKGIVTDTSGTISIKADTKQDKHGHKDIITTIISDNINIKGKDDVACVHSPEKLTAHINFGTLENGINIKKITVDGENIHAKLKGKLYNLGTKEPSYNVEVAVEDSRLEEIAQILPWTENLPKEFNFYKLKKYKPFGLGNGKLTFKGQGANPDVRGHVKLSDLYLIHPIVGAEGNATVNMDFVGQKMNLDVDVPTTNKQKVHVFGYALIDGSKFSEINVKSTDAVWLEPAQEILVPLHEILKFQVGPVPMMKISGYGNIDVHSAGKKVDPHIWGNINFKNGTASFIEVNNLVLNNASGNVKFDDRNVTFKIDKGLINGLPVDIYGDCVVLGKLNVYVKAKGQDVKKLVKTIQTSPILVDVQKVIKPFTNPDGLADVFLHIYGNVDKQAEEVVFNEDLFSKGSVTLHNAKTVMQDTFLPFTDINGVVNFDKYDSDYDVTGYVRNSKVHVYGTGSDSNIDLKAKTDKFKLADIFDLLHPNQTLPYKEELGNLYVAFTGGYKGYADADNIDYNKIKVDGTFLPNMSSANTIKLEGGNFNIDNGFLKTSSLKGLFNNNPFTLRFTSKDIDQEDLNITDAQFNFKNFDVSTVNSIKNQIKLPAELAKEIDNVTDINGKIDINGNIKNNQIYATSNIKNITFRYKPFDALVRVLNGYANVNGETLYLDKVNSTVSSMPVFLNGKISDIYSDNPQVNLAISAKLTQMFFDRFFNSKSVYPIKAKGNINLYSKLSGTLKALNAKSKLNLGENASLYYMGATLAGAPTGALNTEEVTTNPVSIVSDITLTPDSVKVKSLDYNQLITSQNKKVSTQNLLNASGEINLLEDNVIGFKNFKIKTENPTNARIFNILSKKPTIKQGVFTTDLTLNGTSLEPYALGYLNINSIDIPVLDSTVRDINIDFQKDYVNLTTKAIVLTNDILLTAKIANKMVKPYEVEELNILMDELNLNIITNALSEIEADNTRNNVQIAQQVIPADSVIIKDANIKADNVLIKKAVATDFSSHFTLDSNQILNVDNFNFQLANGDINGDIRYDLNDFSGNANMEIKNADASIIAENFFDMQGQVYGNVTGKMTMGCKGISSVDCINTLSGEGSFDVKDGRMPKLGSLEYLLKAGNLITGGVTGLSINGIIDLITPLKTGNFKSISGDVHVKDGIADEINVYSNGQDLNMYLTGSYNLATLVADMEIYGSLSKNLSTLTGKIANTSLNTLFNTIPGININEINPSSTSNINKIPNFNKENTLRVFKAEIFGDINGSNYVKSFRWIKD